MYLRLMSTKSSCSLSLSQTQQLQQAWVPQEEALALSQQAHLAMAQVCTFARYWSSLCLLVFEGSAAAVDHTPVQGVCGI